MKKRVLIVAATTGYQTRMFAEAAERLGYQPVLATDRCHMLEDPWGDSAIPVRFEKAEPSIRAVAAAAPLDGIVAVGDRPALTAAHIAQGLGLRFSPPEAVQSARNKFLARTRFRAAGLPVPVYECLDLEADPSCAAHHTTYPCVLKPLGLSGSRGVIRADNPAQFIAAFYRIRNILALPEIRRLQDEMDTRLQVESFIPGREFALEGILNAGRLHTLAIFDKPDPLEGPYFEETIYITPSRETPETQAALEKAVQRAVTALGLTEGPIHAEARINERGVWILEVAPRPIGGLCAKALRFHSGIGLEELILRHAVGLDVGHVEREHTASGVMMIPIPRAGVFQRAGRVEEALQVPGVEEIVITAKPGQQIVPLPEGGSYLGFIFARAPEPVAVERALRNAHQIIDFEILASLAVTPGGSRG
jgi:biotin carboxylase